MSPQDSVNLAAESTSLEAPFADAQDHTVLENLKQEQPPEKDIQTRVKASCEIVDILPNSSRGEVEKKEKTVIELADLQAKPFRDSPEANKHDGNDKPPVKTIESKAKMIVDEKIPSQSQPKKTKEEIMAEREVKKAEKAARRAKAKEEKGNSTDNQPDDSTKPPTAPSPQKPTKDSDKSKAEIRAERRAKQEAQRAAKEAAKANTTTPNNKKGGQDQQQASGKEEQQPNLQKIAKGAQGQRVSDDMQADRPSVERKLQKKLASQQVPERTKAQRQVVMFSHLHQYERELSIVKDLPAVGGGLHPVIVELGLLYAEGTVVGSNARCVAMMAALKRVINDYTTPEQKELSRDMVNCLKPHITFLRQCRTLSVSMANALRFVKSKINNLSLEISDIEAKTSLFDAIDGYVHKNIVLAGQQIAKIARRRIRDGDVILTYGYSSLLKHVFVEARNNGLSFRVIVADGRPHMEGRQMIHSLVEAGLNCSYVLVTSMSYAMPEVTKVFLGAHAALSNGSIMSRVGASQIALVAHSRSLPVFVCCEGYKFSERSQTDSFVLNELGDPDDLVTTGKKLPPLSDWRDLQNLYLLNLAYDIIPASLIDAIIYEVSIIPTTSVPVVLRLRGAAEQN